MLGDQSSRDKYKTLKKDLLNMNMGRRQHRVFHHNEQADLNLEVTLDSLHISHAIALSMKEPPKEKQPVPLMATDQSLGSPAILAGRNLGVAEDVVKALLSLPPFRKFLVSATTGDPECVSKTRPKRRALQEQSARIETEVARIMRLFSHMVRLKIPLALLLCATVIGPVTAFDTPDTTLAQYPRANTIVPHPRPQMQMGLVGTYILVVAGLVTTTTKNLLGPLMGVSSVMWFIMRNDAAIKPSISWA